MFSHNAFSRLSFVTLAVSGALFMTSCGTDDALGKRYPVSGTVTYNDKPLEKGNISFIPEDPSKNIGASGTIENGSYTLSTGGQGDGARAGKYKVAIAAKEDASEKAKEAFAKAQAAHSKQAGSENSGYVPRQFAAKANAEAKNLIPAGYGDVTTTTLTAEVKEQSNKLDFKLSDAEAPPEPKTPAKGGGRGRR